MQPRLLPIDQLDVAAARRVRGIFTDIDDTLTAQGRLIPEAYAAVCRAADAGLRVIPVTGRPCGWAEVLAATWPVEAVIGEGGAAAAIAPSRGGGWLWWDAGPERARQRERLRSLVDEALTRLPFARLSQDHDLRRVDIAFDIGESQHLAQPDIDQIVGLIHAHGLRSQQSTVHAHAIASDYDKAQMAVRLCRERWGEDEETVRTSYVFVGDSPNDQAGFAFFELSVGVSNVLRFTDRLAPPPRYVTQHPAGHGFAEVVQYLVALRRL